METLNVEFPDDFEEFRARATSGGSMYGIFRRRVISSGRHGGNAPGSDVKTKSKPALPKPFKRQRSRSLITCSPTLVDDKCVLLALFDYAEAKRHQSEVRRHSTAVDGRDLRRVALNNSISKNLNLRSAATDSPGSAASPNFLSPDSCLGVPSSRRNSTTIQIPSTARKCSISLQVPSPSRKSSIASLTSPSRRGSILPPTDSCVLTLPVPASPLPAAQPPSSTAHAPQISVPRLVLNDGDDSDIELDPLTSRDDPCELDSLQQLIVPSVQRRRSFTITQQGIKNHGDVIIQPPPTPSFLSISNTEQRICTPDHLPSPPTDTCSSGEGFISLSVPSIHIDAQLSPSGGVDTRKSFSLQPTIEINDNLRNEHLESSICDNPVAMDTDDSPLVEVPVYRVLTLGGPGVGKTALTQQFMTSEYMAAQNTSFGEDCARIHGAIIFCFSFISV